MKAKIDGGQCARVWKQNRIQSQLRMLLYSQPKKILIIKMNNFNFITFNIEMQILCAEFKV